MDKLTLAYLAGLIDGEGYIGIKRAQRKDATSPIYHERIQVRMVTEGSIRLLAKTLGGSYYCERPHAPGKGRPLYCWQVSDAMASRALDALLPYLVIKQQSARTVLRLRRSKEDPRARRRGSPAKRTMYPHILALRQRLYLRCKELNKVGV